MYKSLTFTKMRNPSTTLRPTMFQCMVTCEEDSFPTNLRRMHANACTHSDVIDIKARAPGSLGQDVCMDEPTWKIGSLSLRLRLKSRDTSVFVFESGKIKISGGSVGHSLPYNTWLDSDIVQPVMEILFLLNGGARTNRFSWNLCLLNGSLTLEPSTVNVATYKKLCQFLLSNVNAHPFFVSATMPACYDVNGGVRRGRVCSIALKFAPKTVQGKKITHASKTTYSTIRFDQGGRVQLFASKSVEELQTASEQLVKWISQFNSENYI